MPGLRAARPRRLFTPWTRSFGRVSRYSFDRIYTRSLISQRRRNRDLPPDRRKGKRYTLSRCVALVQAYFDRQRKAA